MIKIAALSLALTFASAADAAYYTPGVHPWMGLTEVCAADDKGENTCIRLASHERYDTEEHCLEDMRRRVQEFADRVAERRPELKLSGSISCVPNRAEWNA